MLRWMMALFLAAAAGAASAQMADDPARPGIAGAFSRIRTLQKELARTPAREDLHTALALEYLILGQELLFESEISSVLQLNPRSAQANYLLGRFDQEIRQDPAKAVGSFRKALNSAPDSFKAEYYLGLCYRSLGQPDEARVHLQAASERSSYDWPFRALAELEFEQGAYGRAVAAIKQALERGSGEPANYLLAAKIYRANGDSANAVAALRRCIDLDPVLASPHYLLGQIYLSKPETRALGQKELARFDELKDGDP